MARLPIQVRSSRDARAAYWYTTASTILLPISPDTWNHPAITNEMRVVLAELVVKRGIRLSASQVVTDEDMANPQVLNWRRAKLADEFGREFAQLCVPGLNALWRTGEDA